MKKRALSFTFILALIFSLITTSFATNSQNNDIEIIDSSDFSISIPNIEKSVGNRDVSINQHLPLMSSICNINY